jgi:DNA repair photolyase
VLINSKNNVIIIFTITTPDDELSKIIEPNVCVSFKRLQAIKELVRLSKNTLRLPV